MFNFKQLVIFFLIFSLTAGPAFAQTSEPKDPFASIDIPTKKVAYIYDQPTDLSRQVIEGIKKELHLLGKGKYNLVMNDPLNGAGNSEKVENLLAAALKDPDIDLIMGDGLRFTTAALKQLPPAKPIIIADFINHSILGAPYKDGTTGTHNLYYLSRSKTALNDFNVFHKITPFKKLHVVIDPVYFSYAKRAVSKIGKQDYSIYFVRGQKTAAQTMKEIDFQNVEAIYLAPEVMSSQEFQKLVDGINRNKIPTFSFWGYQDVEKGVLAGRMPIYSTKFIRRIALMVDRVLMGEDAGTLPVEFEIADKIVVNQKTANQIGLSIPFNILSQAKVLFADEPQGDLLTLQTAVSEALTNNWIFSIQDETIREAGQDHLSGLSKYLPKLEGRLNFDVIDSGRASHSAGGTPKRAFSYGVSLQQLIFSDPVIKNIQNTKKQIQITRLRKETEELNITQQTIDAYLEYLKAKALLKVERENLNTTELNLNIAQKRQKTGVAGPEEVLRWEADKYNMKADVLTREAAIRQARIVLNQLMNHPQEMLFKEEDIGSETLKYYIGSQEFAPLMRDMKSLEGMLTFSVEQAYEKAPELQALEIALEKQKNLQKQARNKFLLPEANLQGDFADNMSQTFRGASRAARDDSADWMLRMQMTYPLLDGGERFIDIARQNSKYRRIQFTKYLTAQEIELDVRASLYSMYHSYPAIRLTHDAMISSAKNFDVVQKKYSAGIASVTDLADAQRVKFESEGRAMVAIYNFVSDLAAFDRATADFYLLASEDQRREWFTQVQNFLGSK